MVEMTPQPNNVTNLNMNGSVSNIRVSRLVGDGGANSRRTDYVGATRSVDAKLNDLDLG